MAIWGPTTPGARTILLWAVRSEAVTFMAQLVPMGTVYPTPASNGPDDTHQGSSARGRWIPTTAVDQYGATLASWFGVGSTDLAAVFPNIGRFGQSNLGFLA